MTVENIDFDFDVAVLGLGSAGEKLARQAAQAGMSVVGFEPNLVGGECPFTACMPSKSLLHDASHTDRDWTRSVARRNDIVHHRDDSEHADGLRDEGVEIHRVYGEIVGDHRITADGRNFTAKWVVIATGAGTSDLPFQGADSDAVWTSAEALSTDERPEELLIIGGGPIGSELGEVYRRFGSVVTVVERSERFASVAEPSVSNALVSHLEGLGIVVLTGREVASISPTPATKASSSRNVSTVRLDDGKEFVVDRVLNAAGTTPRLKGLGLENVGLTEDPDIAADGTVGGTTWLFAAGDVTPHSHWTHGANYQADSLVQRFRHQSRRVHEPVMPHCVFTSPPLGVVGTTAEQARSQGLDVVTGTARYDEVARAATDELPPGAAAVVVDRQSRRILGASIFGPRGDDLIQIVTALMVGDVTIDDAAQMVFPFPTMSQVLEVALGDAFDQMTG